MKISHNIISSTMLKTLSLVCLMAVAAIIPSAAQDTGSAYSRLGYGLLRGNATSMQRQMGSVGYAMRSGRQINVMNPASYAAIDSLTFLFDMGIDLSSTNLKEGSAKDHQLGGGLDYITMQFPLGKYMGGSIGLLPYSSVGYSFASEITGGTTMRQGSGGFNELYIGLSAKPFTGFTLGANISYLFGSIAHDVQTTPSGSSTALFEQVMEVRDYNLVVGAQYGLTFGKNTVTAGLTYSPAKSFLGHAWVTKYDMTNDIDGNLVKADTVMERTAMRNHFGRPETWGAGLSYSWNNRFQAEADFTYQPWSKARYMEMDNFAGTKLADRWSANFGAEYTHARRGNYISRISWRFGGFYSRDYVMVGSNNIRDYGLTAGFGLPAPNGKTVINLGFEWRHRQAYPQALLTENHFTVTLGINFNELWFFQRKIQ
ncbi:MAG: hypothetical protein NC342_00815 [Pseudoflavonifractor sp.]|nr:hypothetical protein [Alloprevotella sp.]MCM1116063.1 hypothetical protein [Pseudoflavonifractor sp.]